MEKDQAPRIAGHLTPAKTTALSNEQGYLHHATAFNTRRAYQSAIRQFEKYGGLLPATELHIAQYMIARATTLNPRTLSLHITGLATYTEKSVIFSLSVMTMTIFFPYQIGAH